MLLDLGFLLWLTLGADALGQLWIRRLGLRIDRTSDRLALTLPLGLGSLAIVALVWGELGLLTRWSCGATLLACLLPAIWHRDSYRISIPDRTDFRAWLTWDRVWDLLLGAVVLGTFLTALLPVTDGDALCYHLQVPKIFLDHSGVGFDPDLHETVYPLTTEMLYAIALSLRGPVACRLIQWLLGLVFALNVTAMARPWLGDRACWAGAIALLAPAISNGMGAPLNDVALAAFANAGIHAWMRWWDRPDWRAGLLAGVLIGFALGVKYPALVLLGVLGLAMLVRAVRERLFSHLFAFSIAALLLGGCWYLRAYVTTGNPVHPFFRHFFGGAGFDEVLDPIKRPLAVTPFNLATALFPLTLQPERFDSFSHQFGPLYLLFLPLLFIEKPPKRLVGLVMIGFAFLTICLTQRQSMRFVLLALGPFSVGVAWLASQLWSRPGFAPRLLTGMLLVALSFEASLALARPRVGLRYLTGRESASDFLSRREPTYKVGQWINANLPPHAKVIGQDHRGYYLPRDYTMELAHRRRTGLGTRNETDRQIIQSLRDQGFSHLMLCPPVPETAVEFDPTMGRLLATWLANHQPVYKQELGDADGVVRRFAIYDLSDPVALISAGNAVR